MRGMRGYWRAWGLRLALVALALQAAVPLFILVDLRVLAAEQAADAIAGQALCIHDGSSHPAAPEHPCSLSVCPLCGALAAASALGAPVAAAPAAPSFAHKASFAARATAAAPRETRSLPYRSRAPPLA
jgi:hypothetical protein